MQEGNQSHSNIGSDSPVNHNPNGQVSNGNSAPFMGDPNKLGSLNVADVKVAQNVSDKPISEMSNLNYSNATKESSSKTPKGTGLGKYLAVAVISLLLLSGAGFGAYKLVSSSNRQKSSSIASAAVSKTISLNVPVSNNQQSLTPAQTAGQSINLNGDVAIQGSLNTTGAIKSSGNISGQNLNIQGNIISGGSITGSTINGNGSGLTALNANNITSGTLNAAQLPSNVTQLGQSIPLSAIQANIVSSINGIVNNGGNISVVGGGNISVANNQATNTITISSSTGGTITGVTVGSGLTGGGTTGNVAIGLDGSVTLQGNAFNGANELVQLNSSSQLPVLDASNLTNLDATNISSGTVDNARLTGDVTLQGNTFNGASQLVQLGSDGKLTALDGSNLTNLNGANLQTGSVPDSALSSNVCLGSSNNCNYQTAGNYINLQSGTPGTTQTGNINVSGSVIAGSFKGNGSQLTNINGSSISGGTVSSNYLPNTITYQGNTFNGNNELVQTNASGTINDSLLTTNVCLGASNNCNYQTAGNYVSIQGATPGTPQTGNINISGTNIAAYFSGDGHLLSNINASNVTTGTINNLRLSNDVTLQGNTFNGASQLIQTTAIGYIPALNGSLITNLNASSINQGTLSDSRLSSNIPLKNASNTFTQNNTFSGGITTDSIQPSSSLTVGSTSKSLTLQGSSTTISSTNSGGTTTIGFNGTSSGSVNYQFDAATTPGTYFVCTTVGNCGTGSSLSGSGTTGNIALFNGSQNLGNSKISQTGSNVSVAGNLSVAPTVNSTSTFVIQNASANPLFSADTTNGRIGIGNSSPNYPLDVTGNINSSTGLYVNGTKVCDSTGCGSNGESGFYIQNRTSNQTNANFNIQSSSSSSVVGILKGASGQSADLLDLQNSSGTNKVAFSADGNVNIAGAYQINGSQINSSNLSDSSNIGLLNGNQTYTGNNTISGTTTLSGNSTFTGTVLQQNNSDSTAAFKIQNAAGNDNLFVADTTNSRIGIGTNTPGYKLDVNGDVNIAAGSNYLINGTPICSGAYLCAPSKESPYYVQNSTTQQADTNINIKSTSASSVTATLSGTSGQSADILDLINSDGNFISRSTQFGSSAVTLLGQSDNLTGTLGLQSASTTNNIFFQPTSIDGGLSNAIITVPDENGQICTSSGSELCFAKYAKATGSGAYVGLQGDTPGTVQNGSLNIHGTAIAGSFNNTGSSFQVTSGGAITGTQLTLGSGTITSGTINGATISGGSVSGSSLSPNALTFSGASALISGNGTTGGLSLQGGSGAGSLNLNTANTGNTSIGNGTGTFALTSNGGLNVTTAGAITGASTINGQTISSSGSTINSVTLNAGVVGGVTSLTASGAIQGGSFNNTGSSFQVTSGGAITGTQLTLGSGTITSGTINGATISGGTLSNTGVGGTGAFAVSSGGSSALALSSGSGNVSTGTNTINGQTISSAANFTGTLGVTGAITGGTYNTATISGGSLSGTAVNGLNVSGTAIQGTGALSITSTTSPLTLNTATISTTGAITGTSVAATNYSKSADIVGGSSTYGSPITQSVFTITGSGFTQSMNGGIITYQDGTTGVITYISPTSLTSSVNKTISPSQNLTISYGFTVDSSGNVNTTGYLSTTGLTTSGADVNINASSNFNTNINTGTSTGSVTIGNSLSTTNITGTTNINSGSTTSSSTSNIGTSYNGSTTYSVGTISQGIGTTSIVGSGTTFTAAMTGGTITYYDTTTAIITFKDATHLNSSVVKTVPPLSTYSISNYSGGTVNIGNAAGSVAISGKITSSVTLQVGNGAGGGSTTSFLINNASGSQLLAADSITGQIIVGSSSNGVALSSSGLTLSGTAQRLRTITLTPEYSGAVLDSGGLATDIGTMTAGFDSTIANFSGSAWINGAGESYYNWTTSQGTNETYDVVVRVPLPSDWSGWNGTYPISIDTRASTTSGSTVSAFLFDTNGSAESSWNSCSVTVNTVWTKINPSCGLSGTYAADGIMTLRLRLASTGNNTQLGNIYLKYNSKW
jgi:hypothetical protein